MGTFMYTPGPLGQLVRLAKVISVPEPHRSF